MNNNLDNNFGQNMNNEENKVIKAISETNNINSSNVIRDNNAVNNNQINTIESNMQQNESIKIIGKKKLKWWIPVSFFAGFVVFQILSLLIEFIANNNCSNSLNKDMCLSGINNFTVILSFLAIICGVMAIPSVIIIMVMYLANKNDDSSKVIAGINNANSLEDKMLIAYIGKNYDKIMSNKFSIPFFLFGEFYASYRKYYPFFYIGIILMLLPDESLIFSLSPIIFIAFSFSFNKSYASYAKKRVAKIKQDNSNLSEIQLINICQQKGGTSDSLVFILLLIPAVRLFLALLLYI